MKILASDFPFQIETILPQGMISDYQLISDEPIDLCPEENQLTTHMGPKRKQEFAAGRLIAKQLLAQVGIHHHPLLQDKKSRIPLWPKGYIGSLSHSKNHIWGVLAQQSQYPSVGIDIEQKNRIKTALWHKLFTPSEMQFLKNQPINDQPDWATVYFTIKEAFYKYQYPLTGQFLGFLEVEIQATNRASCIIKSLKENRLEARANTFINHQLVGSIVY